MSLCISSSDRVACCPVTWEVDGNLDHEALAPRPDGGVPRLFGLVVRHIALDAWPESGPTDLAVAYDAYHCGTNPALLEPPSLAEAWKLVESHRRHAYILEQPAVLAQNIFVYQDHPALRLYIRDRRARLFWQPHIGICAEFQTDIWPLEDQGLRITIHFQPSAVGRSSVDGLMRFFEDCCRGMARLLILQEEDHGFGDRQF